MPAFTHLLIPRAVFDAVIEHARREVPNECCGLLAGFAADGLAQVSRRFPIRNDRASATEFLTNPRDLLDAMKAARAGGIEILAIYHSHPSSAAVPSRKDIEQNEWGDAAAHLIVGLAGRTPELRAWSLSGSGASELAVAIMEQD